MPIDNLESFVSNLETFARTLAPGPLLLFRKKMFILALDGVVKTTAVKSGRARGNWQYSEAAPVANEVPESRWDTQGAKTIAQEGGKADRGIQDPFGVSFLVNNVPYAERLEHGWSRRHPDGMVGVTLRRLNRMLERGLAAKEVGL